MVALARGMLRHMEIMRPRVSSATATALAPGVFMTTMPRLGGFGCVDVVDADAGAADDAELGSVREEGGVGLDSGADDEGVGVGELRQGRSVI